MSRVQLCFRLHCLFRAATISFKLRFRGHTRIFATFPRPIKEQQSALVFAKDTPLELLLDPCLRRSEALNCSVNFFYQS
jgi:hypothetical protein